MQSTIEEGIRLSHSESVRKSNASFEFRALSVPSRFFVAADSHSSLLITAGVVRVSAWSTVFLFFADLSAAAKQNCQNPKVKIGGAAMNSLRALSRFLTWPRILIRSQAKPHSF
jgi:hypothetical protein